jgi:hypothetical protein
MAEIGTLALFILACVGIVGAIRAAGKWILGPLVQAVGDRSHPVQFTMLDFCCLLFLLQLPLGLVHSTMTLDEAPTIWILDGFGWAACTLAWLLSVRTLSRAGIHKPWYRAVFLALCVPTVYFGLVAVAVLIIVIGFDAAPGRPAQIISLSAALTTLACALLLAGRFVRHMLADTAASPHRPMAASAEHEVPPE